MSNDQAERFHHAMLEIYDAAAKLKPPYRASRFKLMVNERGGKATADSLLAKATMSNGFTELYMRGPENLRLSVEYLVLKPEWRGLFTEEQRRIARKRLTDVECPLPE